MPVKSIDVPLVELTAVPCVILCNCARDALLSVPKNCPLYSRLPAAGVPISVSEVKTSIDMVFFQRKMEALTKVVSVAVVVLPTIVWILQFPAAIEAIRVTQPPLPEVATNE